MNEGKEFAGQCLRDYNVKYLGDLTTYVEALYAGVVSVRAAVRRRGRVALDVEGTRNTIQIMREFRQGLADLVEEMADLTDQLEVLLPQGAA
jgi:hypothetical protein